MRLFEDVLLEQAGIFLGNMFGLQGDEFHVVKPSFRAGDIRIETRESELPAQHFAPIEEGRILIEERGPYMCVPWRWFLICQHAIHGVDLAVTELYHSPEQHIFFDTFASSLCAYIEH